MRPIGEFHHGGCRPCVAADHDFAAWARRRKEGLPVDNLAIRQDERLTRLQSTKKGARGDTQSECFFRIECPRTRLLDGGVAERFHPVR